MDSPELYAVTERDWIVAQHYDPSTNPVAWNYGLRSIQEYFDPNAPNWREVDKQGFLRDPDGIHVNAVGSDNVSDSQNSFQGRASSGSEMQAGTGNVFGHEVLSKNLRDGSTALSRKLEDASQRMPICRGPPSPTVVIEKNELASLGISKVSAATGPRNRDYEDDEETLPAGSDYEGESSQTETGDDPPNASIEAQGGYHQHSFNPRATTSSAQSFPEMNMPYGSGSNAMYNGHESSAQFFPEPCNNFNATYMPYGSNSNAMHNDQAYAQSGTSVANAPSSTLSTRPKPYLLPSPMPDIGPGSFEQLSSYRRGRHTNPTQGALSLRRDMEQLPALQSVTQPVPYNKRGDSSANHAGSMRSFSDIIDRSRKRKLSMNSRSSTSPDPGYGSRDPKKASRQAKMLKIDVDQANGFEPNRSTAHHGDDPGPRSDMMQYSKAGRPTDIYEKFMEEEMMGFVVRTAILGAIEAVGEDCEDQTTEQTRSGNDQDFFRPEGAHAALAEALDDPEICLGPSGAETANRDTPATTPAAPKSAYASIKTESKTQMPQVSSWVPHASKSRSWHKIGDYEMKMITGEVPKKSSGSRRRSLRLEQQNPVEGPNAGQAAKKRHSMK